MLSKLTVPERRKLAADLMKAVKPFIDLAQKRGYESGVKRGTESARHIPAGGPIPARHGAYWEEEEEQRLIKYYKQGHTIEKIASFHERNELAIAMRLQKLGLIKQVAPGVYVDNTLPANEANPVIIKHVQR